MAVLPFASETTHFPSLFFPSPCMAADSQTTTQNLIFPVLIFPLSLPLTYTVHSEYCSRVSHPYFQLQPLFLALDSHTLCLLNSSWMPYSHLKLNRPHWNSSHFPILSHFSWFLSKSEAWSHPRMLFSHWIILYVLEDLPSHKISLRYLEEEKNRPSHKGLWWLKSLGFAKSYFISQYSLSKLEDNPLHWGQHFFTSAAEPFGHGCL